MLTLPGPIVSVAWLAAHRDDPGLRIVDARWARNGPSGRDAYDNVGPDSHFLSPDRLRNRYVALGAKTRPVVAYCGSSLTATHDLLALELAGIDGARLYEGSWSDWSSDPSRPADTGSEQ